MKIVYISTLILGLYAPMAQAQDSEVKEGFSLLEQGAKLLMRGLITEMEPAMTDLRNQFEDMAPVIGEFAQEMGPALSELLDRVDDFRYYDAPEFLPNGDIIVRRKPTAPLWKPDDSNSEIEL